MRVEILVAPIAQFAAQIGRNGFEAPRQRHRAAIDFKRTGHPVLGGAIKLAQQGRLPVVPDFRADRADVRHRQQQQQFETLRRLHGRHEIGDRLGVRQIAPERQLPQAGIELIGSDTVAADAEVAAVALVLSAHGESATGLPGAAAAIGSIGGGALLALRPARGDLVRAVGRLVLLAGAAVVGCAFLPWPGLLLALGVAGASVSPGMALAYLLAEQRSAQPGSRASAVVGAALNTGGAVGSGAAGSLVQATGARAALVVLGAVAAVTALLPWALLALGRRGEPHRPDGG